MMTKFCTSCTQWKKPGDGKKVATAHNDTKRWKCTECLSKSKKPGNKPGPKPKPRYEDDAPSVFDDQTYLHGCGYG